jgi:hypothetical protein
MYTYSSTRFNLGAIWRSQKKTGLNGIYIDSKYLEQVNSYKYIGSIAN